MKKEKKIVLAYSGGLDTSIILRWLQEKYNAEVIRFFILSSHYRSQLNYSSDNLDEAKSALTRLYTALKGSNHESAVDKRYLADFNSVSYTHLTLPTKRIV